MSGEPRIVDQWHTGDLADAADGIHWRLIWSGAPTGYYLECMPVGKQWRRYPAGGSEFLIVSARLREHADLRGVGKLVEVPKGSLSAP